jgi:ABC-type uncharacterized transport system substrate-binding protein
MLKWFSPIVISLAKAAPAGGMLLPVFALFLSLSTPCWASPYHVSIITSGKTDIYNRVIDTIIDTTRLGSTASITFNIVNAQDISTNTDVQQQALRSDLLLTVGLRAADSIAKLPQSPPVITTLIPKSAYEHFLATRKKQHPETFITSTALYLENPPKRQILLAKILLGDLHSIGILTSQANAKTISNIQAISEKQGLQLKYEIVGASDNLISKLSLLLYSSDALLALPDPHIFNRKTIRNILLTTYRHRSPVIGFSASYVKAGALAAVYSTPNQIAKQAGNILAKTLNSKLKYIPSPVYPDNFSVRINQNVARSLGIAPIDESIAHRKLQEMEKKQ